MADTNVIVRGVRSKNGASGYVLRRMLTGEIAFAASPAVILEYEAVLKRPGVLGGIEIDEPGIDLILDALCYRAIETMP